MKTLKLKKKFGWLHKENLKQRIDTEVIAD